MTSVFLKYKNNFTVSIYLSHCQRSFLGEGVVIEVQHSQVSIVLHGSSQRRYALMVDPILRHVYFLKTTNQLRQTNKQTKGINYRP